MENFKYILSSIFILALLGFGGYWAFSTIETGSSHVDIQKQKELENINEELEKEIVELKGQINVLEAEKKQLVLNQEAPAIETPSIPTTTNNPPKQTVLKYQSLINELQKLVDGNIYLKNKSQGPAVGSIQKFLNIYGNTTLKVDNDYGVSVGTAVKNFQKDQGLTSDGEIGPGTLKKMISWLKSK